MSEYVETGYRCGVCGEEYWNTSETTVTVRRRKHGDDFLTTTVWEFHICDGCLEKMKGVDVRWNA